MQFKNGASVYTFDGRNVGHIDRVVLNPKTKEVTHIVVRKGFLFTEDKIVPMSLIASTTEDSILLKEDAGNLNDLPPFEETHYIALDENQINPANSPSGRASALYWYQPMGGGVASFGEIYPPVYRTETEQNIPDDTVALKEGTHIFNGENEHIGNLTRVFTDSRSGQVTSFLMSEGVIFKHKKLIPVSWISTIEEGRIYLNVGAGVLEKVPEYQEA